jgi:acyl-CoA thioesterase-1
MGSSTAAGTGTVAGKGWVALLKTEWASKGDVLVNIAKAGINTYEALSITSAPVANKPLPDPAVNIDQALSRSPTLVILAFPTNDTASGFSTDETVANLLSIRAKALAASVPVVVVSTQPRDFVGAKLSQLRAIDERMAKEVGACFVPVRVKLAGPDDKLAAIYDAGDGAHPNEAGHAVIASAINEVLRSGACVTFAP